MAVIQDPTGAFSCIWQAKSHHGMTVAGENGTFGWADLSTGHPDRARQFYLRLFGWKIAPAESYPPDYLLSKNGGELIDGIAPSHAKGTAPPHWMLFFLTAVVDGVAAKAKEMGGSEHLAPVRMRAHGVAG